MNKNILLYLIVFVLFISITIFSYRAYREVVTHSEENNRYNSVYGLFLNLSREINNVAVFDISLVSINEKSKKESLFYTDSLKIFQKLELLQATVRDAENILIADQLQLLISAEFPWIYKSNVPDSMHFKQSPVHIAAYNTIDSLINKGIQRTYLSIELRKKELATQISGLSIWISVFMFFSAVLIFFITRSLFHQQSKRHLKEQELANVFSRINDSVVSVDNQWRYTFLNEAAMSTHPLPLEKTLGQVIWDVHPEMHGTIFYDEYHRAMADRVVVEVDSYYEAMDIWFSAKVYPSADGLTIFYKDVSEAKKAEQQLTQTLKEVSDYKYALDESSIIAITNQAGIINYVNNNFCKISKYSREELIGQDHRIISSGHHSKAFISNLWNTIANGKVWKGELKNKAKDGSVYWVDTSIVPFLNNKGKPYQYLAIRSDITERKKIEEQQVLSASIINSSDDAIMSKTLEGIITSWNHGAKKVFQYSKEEIIGKHISLLTSPDVEGEEIAIISKIRNGETIDHYETRYISKDGKLINVSLTISPIKDEDGHIIGASQICRDVTMQKIAEEKLIKSEKIYKTIASNIPGSFICLLDTEFRYFLAEGDLIDKLGYSKEKLLGHRIEDVLSNEILIKFQHDLTSVLSGKNITVESNRLGYDIISRYIPLKDDSNIVYAIMTVTIDVTELKSVHRNISELNRGLEEKILERTIQLKKSNEELEAFSYSVSHDLRAPLRAIYGYANILEEDYYDLFDAEGKRLLGEVQLNAKKMGVLIDNLLSFSRLGRKEVERSKVDMNVLFAGVINEIQQHTTYKAEIRLSDLLPVEADWALIHQVIFNLLSNAFKYSSKKSQPIIEVGCWREREKLIYFIKDNGAGFEMEYSHKLFGVFQRLHSEEEFEGTGVGLAIVERIIQKHNGQVWAESKLGEGATFYFALPEISSS